MTMNLYFMLLMSIMFINLSHPLSMGLILLIQTINISLMISLINIQSWFSYIFFLIMVGGMLILFIYMTSIASNEKFKFSMKIFLIFIGSNLTMVWLMGYYYHETYSDTLFYTPIPQSFNQFFNYPNNLILTILFIYLFITLIAVVKITNINNGPLRQLN
uniref:NADH-ubiquinone oxidoreductase chain 6 n=1 Tax=Staphylinoidea sp. 11 KM-2017 TaxID=2219451 RepID=A0A346RHZ1_9COLE|nr:NADH dehydrogenase subunit 6 [Staphylinoidea sp. 11 KM-2017]